MRHSSKHRIGPTVDTSFLQTSGPLSLRVCADNERSGSGKRLVALKSS